MFFWIWKKRKTILILESKSVWLIENWQIAEFEIFGHWFLVANLLIWTIIWIWNISPFTSITLTGTINLLSTQSELLASNEFAITLKTPFESTVNKSSIESSTVKSPSKPKFFKDFYLVVTNL